MLTLSSIIPLTLISKIVLTVLIAVYDVYIFESCTDF